MNNDLELKSIYFPKNGIGTYKYRSVGGIPELPLLYGLSIHRSGLVYVLGW